MSYGGGPGESNAANGLVGLGGVPVVGRTFSGMSGGSLDSRGSGDGRLDSRLRSGAAGGGGASPGGMRIRPPTGGADQLGSPMAGTPWELDPSRSPAATGLDRMSSGMGLDGGYVPPPSESVVPSQPSGSMAFGHTSSLESLGASFPWGASASADLATLIAAGGRQVPTLPKRSPVEESASAEAISLVRTSTGGSTGGADAWSPDGAMNLARSGSLMPPPPFSADATAAASSLALLASAGAAPPPVSAPPLSMPSSVAMGQPMPATSDTLSRVGSLPTPGPEPVDGSALFLGSLAPALSGMVNGFSSLIGWGGNLAGGLTGFPGGTTSLPMTSATSVLDSMPATMSADTKSFVSEMGRRVGYRGPEFASMGLSQPFGALPSLEGGLESDTPLAGLKRTRSSGSTGSAASRKRKKDAKREMGGKGAAWAGSISVRHHQNKPERGPDGKYGCEECGKRFRSRSDLTAHIRTHTGEKPLKCKFPGCEKRFAHSSNLRQHERSHTGEKRYPCTWPGCDKRFAHPSSRNDHLASHQGVRPHKCHLCDRDFTAKANLKRHLKVIHKEVTPKPAGKSARRTTSAGGKRGKK